MQCHAVQCSMPENPTLNAQGLAIALLFVAPRNNPGNAVLFQHLFHCLRRVVSLGPISGLALLLPSGLAPPIIPMAGNSGPGLE
jgi:hypothetical protein